ncbi:MAG: lmo0937 family membrane protein [Candidatus Roizmanbacteria bacterium]|nr:lmo0937 family membrane protein [Candidatus Roizmanbacteria bacterium]
MGLIDFIIVILIISWLGGFALHIGGGLIHLILVIALIVLVARVLGFSV